jgi:DNA-binding MarR family transcriptional regulator
MQISGFYGDNFRDFVSASAVATASVPLTSLLVDVGAEVSAQLADRLLALDVSPADVQVLRLVATAGGMSQRETAARLGAFPTHVGSRVAALCRRGLIERRVYRDRRRRYGLFITSDGTALLDAVSHVRDAHQAELFGALSEQEQEVLERLLERLAHGASTAERQARPRRR